jgi:hypothetical protein
MVICNVGIIARSRPLRKLGGLQMKFGLCYFPTQYGMSPRELAAAAEERGFESLLFSEHTHIPASRQTPYPLGGDLPRMYWNTYDPFVACTAAAAATSTLKIGTGICLIVQRDPIITAKEVASVDASELRLYPSCASCLGLPTVYPIALHVPMIRPNR